MLEAADVRLFGGDDGLGLASVTMCVYSAGHEV